MSGNYLRNYWMAKPSGLILLASVALICSMASAQQQQQQSSVVAVQPAQASNDTKCATTSTKPNLTQESHVFQTCIVAKFAAYFSLGPNKYIELKNGHVDNTASHCEKNATNTTDPLNPMLVVNFDCGQIEFEFEKLNETGVQGIAVKSINGNYKLGNNVTTFTNSTQMFKILNMEHYYKCNSEQTVESKGTTHQLVLSNLAFEAFRTTSGTDFYRLPEECALDSSQVSDLVRIGVGICLVALVALVLVAYFVGRRRWSERSSYESV